MTPSVSLTLDRDAARLSDAVRAVLAVEGPAPLVVDAPADVLLAPSATAWQVRPTGPATVEKLPNNRERWAREYRLDPFATGDAVPVQFAPLAVTAGGKAATLDVPARAVAVRTVVGSPDPADARPITGVEELPPLPGSGGGGWPVAAGVVVAAGLLIAAAAVIRRQRRPAPVPPAVWVERELTALEKEMATGRSPAAVVARLAGVLRLYVERRDGLPATRRTTSELAAAAGPLLPVLARCDELMFAGREATPAECGEVLAAARAAVG